MQLARVWLIGGTRESAQLAKELVRARIPCTVTVTTAAAEALYPRTEFCQVRVASLAKQELEQFIYSQQIGAILDASHPYATVISQSAIAIAHRHHLPYLRYERPAIESQTGQDPSLKHVVELDSFETLIAGDYLHQQRALLTIGYKALPLFRPWQSRATLFARVLPSVNSVGAALEAGFTSDRLIALRPPLSVELETALCLHWQISLMVTKASGQAGGEDVKRAVAAKLGIGLVVIARPRVEYPQQTSNLQTALDFCYQHLLEP